MNTVKTFPNGIGFVCLKDQFKLAGQEVAISIVDGLGNEKSEGLLQVRFQRFLALVELLLDFG